MTVRRTSSPSVSRTRPTSASCESSARPAHRRPVNAARGGRAAVAQVDGARWLSLEGTVRLVTDPEGVAAAIAAYTERYQEPRENPNRVAIEIAVDRILGRG